MKDSHVEQRSSAQEPARPPSLGPVASGLVSLFLAGSFVLLGPIALIVAPLAAIPILRFEAERGGSALVWGPVVVILVAAASAGGGVVALSVLAAYLLVAVLPTVSVVAWARSGWPEGRWVAVTVLAFALVLVTVAVVATLPQGPVDIVAEWARSAAQDAGEFYTSMGVGRGEVQRAMDQVPGFVAWTLPSMLVFYLVAILFWIRPRLPMLGFDVPIGPFESYRSDEWLPVVFALSGLGAVVLGGTFRWVALNLLLPVLALYFVHGLAIIRAHLARWIGRGWLVRWGVAILALQMPLPAVVALLGLVDAFRPLRPQLNEDGGME
ncbi:MAG: DUF2232 domain-containing protein [Acidobacteria bacterium]|nr:DUF2232 domain-containing protein [Acidobacteriota bacterium]